WVVVHHFVTIGQYSFIGGASRVGKDVPPYMLLQGMGGEIRGINSVGLQRRGFKPEAINALREAHRILYRSGLPKPEALAELEKMDGQYPEIRTVVEFLRAADTGHMGRRRDVRRKPAAAASTTPPPDTEDDIE